MDDFKELTARAKQLLKKGAYKISYHVLYDHPERKITAVDIIECLKIGSIAEMVSKRR